MASGAPPVPSPLTSEDAKNPFTDTQWTTLLAIMDTIIPSIQRDSTDNETTSMAIPGEEYDALFKDLQERIVQKFGKEEFDKFLNEKASDNVEFQASLKRIFGHVLPEDNRKGLAFILSTLDTRVGCMLLTGYTTSFHEQPVHVRQAIVNGWRLSYLPTLNLIYKSVMALSKHLWARTSPQLRKLIDIPDTPDHVKLTEPFEFEFLTFSSGVEPEIIETDIIIVGSGCGGAVCAKNLAEAGHKVLVVDKGYYVPASQLPFTEQEGLQTLFEADAGMNSDDGSIVVVAGSTWGGGGTVNWSASLQPQEFVRKEWSQTKGLKMFETAEFQDCLDRVCGRMGVSTDHIKHNHANRNLLEGSRKLGYAAKAVPQNTGGNQHYCGHCSMGCGSSGKQGPAVTWLPDAVRAGAKIVEGFKIDRVLFDEEDPTKAVGVKGVWTSKNSQGKFGVLVDTNDCTVREVIVKAKKVIISSGTLRSPLILQNSGLKNWHIGRNLHLHPVGMMSAVFKEETRPWEGAILTSVSTAFENLDTLGHGSKLECTTMLPSMVLVCFPWISGPVFKVNALKFGNMNGYISIARDRDTGRVYADPISGNPRVQYTPSAFDRQSILEGMVGLAKIAYVQGATEIFPFVNGLESFVRDPKEDPSLGVMDPLFQNWIEEMRRKGNKPPSGNFTSAHQMGTCRMSATESDGVVDEKGRVWGYKGLYVADASVFPSASGVNPMITNMAISDWISRGIIKEELGMSKKV